MTDTSPEYIKMCDCEEVQGWAAERIKDLQPSYIYDHILKRLSMYLWMPPSLQKKLNMDTDEIILSIEKDNPSGEWYDPQPGRMTWLPTQRQLQGMIDPDPDNWDMVLLKSDIFRQHNYDKVDVNWNEIDSHEKMWLALVMAELHKKKWDGERWVEVNWK